MKNTFAYFKNINNYTTLYNSRNNANSPIDDQTICFIEEGGEIYTHGKQFGGGNGSDTTTIGGETINVITEGGNKVIDPTNLPKAGINKLGILGLKLGGGVKIDSNTMIYVDPAETLQNIKQYISQYPSTEMPLTPASKTKLGGVIIGDGIDVASSGKISVNVQEIKNMFTNAGITFGGASSLSQLSDVLVSGTPITGQVLKWNGSKWAPGTDETGNGGNSPANYVIGWSTSGNKITLSDNHNNSVELQKYGTGGESEPSRYLKSASYHTGTLLLVPNTGETVEVHVPMNLHDITDVDSIDARNGQVLTYVYDGEGKWVPRDVNLGTTVVANPDENTDLVLSKIKINGSVYKISSSSGNPEESGTTVGLANAFARIKIGQYYMSADGSDEFTFVAGNNIAIDPDYENNIITISSTGTNGTVVQGNPGGTDSNTQNLTSINIGGSLYKIPTGTNGNANTFGRIIVGDINIDASGSDAFSLVAGTNITLTPSAANKTITISATGGGNGGGSGLNEDDWDDINDQIDSRITTFNNTLNTTLEADRQRVTNINNSLVNRANSLQDYLDELKGKVGKNQYWDDNTNEWVTIVVQEDPDGTVNWSEISQSVNGLTARVASLENTEDGHYNSLTSGLNLTNTKITTLESTVTSTTAELGSLKSKFDANENPIEWLAAFFTSSVVETQTPDKTMSEAIAEIHSSAFDLINSAIAQVRTSVTEVDGRITQAESQIGSLVNRSDQDWNNAGLVTTSTLDGSVASLFASTGSGSGLNTKVNAKAFIEARIGDMVAKANGEQSDATSDVLSQLVLGADQILINGSTEFADGVTVKGALDAINIKADSITADYINSKVSETGYLKVYKTTTSGTADTTSPEHAYLTYGSLVFNTTDVDSQFNVMSKLVSDDYSHIDSTGFIFYGKDNNSLPKERNTDAGAYNSGISLLTRNGSSFLKMVDPNSHHSAYVTPGMFYLGATSTDSDSYDSITSPSAPSSRTTGTKSNLATIRMTADYDNNSTSIILTDNDGVTCTITPAGGANTSDIRYKDIIDDIYVDINDIAAAPKFTYTVKDSTSGVKYAGTSAQYWKNIIPEVVNEDQNGALSMNYANTALIAAISAAEEIVALKNEIAELKQQIVALTSNN